MGWQDEAKQMLLRALVEQDERDLIPPIMCDVISASVWSARTETESVRLVAIHYLLDCDCGSIPEHRPYVASFGMDGQTAYELGLTLMSHAERVGYNPSDFSPEDIIGPDGNGPSAG